MQVGVELADVGNRLDGVDASQSSGERLGAGRSDRLLVHRRGEVVAHHPSDRPGLRVLPGGLSSSPCSSS